MSMKTTFIFKDHNGAALIVALIMMIVLTLIGLAATFTSTFEIILSGNIRGSTDAFYAADSGVQVVMADVGNFDLGKYGADNKYEYSLDVNNTNPTKADIIIYHDTTTQGGPRGFGMGTQQVEFIHYLVASTGQDQTESGSSKSKCLIDEKVVRLVPMQGGN